MAMFTDKIHPFGWIALFEALAKPCECEQGITADHNGKRIVECALHPFPRPGFRWYREMVREAQLREQDDRIFEDQLRRNGIRKRRHNHFARHCVGIVTAA